MNEEVATQMRKRYCHPQMILLCVYACEGKIPASPILNKFAMQLVPHFLDQINGCGASLFKTEVKIPQR